ncbi:hypothetical protein P4234_24365 [Pseudomonas aeruginosa]|nr:hypothetical protein [Pseudomonas aeruginosa]
MGVAYLAQHNGGYNATLGRHPAEPATALTTSGSQQNVVTASLVTLRNGCTGRDLRRSPSDNRRRRRPALMECTLSPENEAGALRVAAFLMGYYGSDNTYDPRDPAATITTRDRLALVTVTIRKSLRDRRYRHADAHAAGAVPDPRGSPRPTRST